MARITEVYQFMERDFSGPVVDVRSPSEYLKGHIPGALNIPLLDDSERVKIGTVYKTSGSGEAVLEGFRLVASSVPAKLEEIRKLSPEKEIRVYCWRGGMRSGAMGWLFESFGYRCIILKGGYKEYRRLVRQILARSYHLVVIGGMTGSGKTDILHVLSAMGEQVLDLEFLASHKGSAFGWLGEKSQPGNEHFENLIASVLSGFDPSRPVFVEDESRTIGHNMIPPELFVQMQEAKTVIVDMPLKMRAERLVRNYGSYKVHELRQCFERIGKRLGGQGLKEAIGALETGNLMKAAEISLGYYDKTYEYGLGRKRKENLIRFNTASIDPEVNASRVIDIIKALK